MPARELEEVRAEYERQIRELRRQVKAEADRRRAPSFESLLANYGGHHRAAMRLKDRAHSAMTQIPFKLRSYSLAQSHGVRTPAVFGVWPGPAKVDLSTVPGDAVVVKSDGGAGAKSVFPLRRTGDGWESFDGAIAFAGDQLPDGVCQVLAKQRGPIFAEEFLGDSSLGEIPEDVKVYAFNGEVAHALVMRSGERGSMDRTTFGSRFFGVDGAALGEVYVGMRYDHTLRRPEPWEELVEAARHMSRAVGLPLVRVDLYATERGPVLGELTSVPSGGVQSWEPAYDVELARMWLDAQARLERDLMRGRPPGALYGSHPYAWHYPDSVDPMKPSAWPRRETDCSTWCT